MSGPGSSARAALVLLAGATLLLAGGLAVELGLTRPQLDELRNLERRQDEFLARNAGIAAQMRETTILTEALRVDSLPQLRRLGEGSDPLVFLGRLVRQAHLQSQTVTSQGATVQDGLRRSRFTLRVLGDYDELLGFVRTLEQSARPITVDAFQINTTTGTSQLEGSFEISIYDPIAEDQP